MPKINKKILSKPSPIVSGTYKLTIKCFFEQSKLFEAQITELFDDLWPTLTAIQNLMWQVSGYYHMTGISQNEMLSRKFVDDSDVSNRPNLYRSCLERTMDQWKYNLAKNLLTNIFAIYEGWIETLLPQLTSKSIDAKNFQFPNSWKKSLTDIQSNHNVTLENAHYDSYKIVSKHYNLNHMDNYFKIFRYFKEYRNCIIHNGGTSNQKLLDAYNDIKNLTPNDIDVNEFPQIDKTSKLGANTNLYLRGVVGFSQILLKIVYTLDVEFIKAEKAIDYYIAQLKKYNPYIMNFTPTNQEKKILKLKGLARKSAFKEPEYSDDLFEMYKHYGLISM